MFQFQLFQKDGESGRVCRFGVWVFWSDGGQCLFFCVDFKSIQLFIVCRGFQEYISIYFNFSDMVWGLDIGYSNEGIQVQSYLVFRLRLFCSLVRRVVGIRKQVVWFWGRCFCLDLGYFVFFIGAFICYSIEQKRVVRGCEFWFCFVVWRKLCFFLGFGFLCCKKGE